MEYVANSDLQMVQRYTKLLPQRHVLPLAPIVK